MVGVIALLFGLSVSFRLFLIKSPSSDAFVHSIGARVSGGGSFLNRIIRISGEHAERRAARVSLMMVLCIIAILGMIVCYN